MGAEFKDLKGNVVDVGDDVVLGVGGANGGIRLGTIVSKRMSRPRYYASQAQQFPVIVVHYRVKNWNGSRETKVGRTLTIPDAAKRLLKT